MAEYNVPLLTVKGGVPWHGIVPAKGSFVEKGRILFVDEAYVSLIHYNYREYICSYCYRSFACDWRGRDVHPEDCRVFQYPRKKLRGCDKCSFVFFCDSACELMSQRGHAVECPGLAQLTNDEIGFLQRNPTILLFARAVIKAQTLAGMESKVVPVDADEDVTKTFEDLTSDYHPEEKIDEEYGHFEFLAKKIVPSAIWNSLSDVKRFTYYVRCRMNRFDLDADQPFAGAPYHTIGQGCFLLGKCFRHGCIPTATMTNFGKYLYVRAIKDIHDFSWEKVRICFRDDLMFEESRDRKRILQDMNHGGCNCNVCEDPRRDMVMWSMLCPTCGSGSVSVLEKETLVRPGTLGLVPFALPCVDCGAETFDLTRMFLFRNVLGKCELFYWTVRQRGLRMNGKPCDTFVATKPFVEQNDLPEIQKLLRAMKGAHFHPLNKFFLYFYTYLTQLTIRDSEELTALKALVYPLQLYTGECSSWMIKHYMKLAVLFNNRKDTHETVMILDTLNKAAALATGEFHPTYKRIKMFYEVL